MTPEERHYFERLKARIAEKQAGNGSERLPEEWSGQEIENFREDLREAVQGTVSEKWFYTHFRSGGQQKLPRIDTLNLLSRYLGYRDWEDFKADHPFEGAEKNGEVGSWKGRRSVRAFSLLFLLLLFGLIPFLYSEEEEGYRFCFVDADTGEPVRSKGFVVKVLEEGESPLLREPDSGACTELPMGDGELRLVVEAPYYRTDTIHRSARDRKEMNERIRLERDDYALLIGAWSEQDPKDREKRRRRLEEMIAADARIFQVHGEKGQGVALYNKEEFIDKLTMPLQSLERIELIETTYNEAGRIRSIRFRQATEKKQKP